MGGGTWRKSLSRGVVTQLPIESLTKSTGGKEAIKAGDLGSLTQNQDFLLYQF